MVAGLIDSFLEELTWKNLLLPHWVLRSRWFKNWRRK
jgi:hypothetical protein